MEGASGCGWGGERQGRAGPGDEARVLVEVPRTVLNTGQVLQGEISHLVKALYPQNFDVVSSRQTTEEGCTSFLPC